MSQAIRGLGVYNSLQNCGYWAQQAKFFYRRRSAAGLTRHVVDARFVTSVHFRKLLFWGVLLGLIFLERTAFGAFIAFLVFVASGLLWSNHLPQLRKPEDEPFTTVLY